MTDNLSSEFEQRVQSVGPEAREAAIRNDIASVFKNSTSDTFRGWNDNSFTLEKEQAEQLYKRFGTSGQISINIGDLQTPHTFDVRMKHHGGENYSLALYEGGQHAGTGVTSKLDLTPEQIYAENPLKAPQAVAAFKPL